MAIRFLRLVGSCITLDTSPQQLLWPFCSVSPPDARPRDLQVLGEDRVGQNARLPRACGADFAGSGTHGRTHRKHNGQSTRFGANSGARTTGRGPFLSPGTMSHSPRVIPLLLVEHSSVPPRREGGAACCAFSINGRSSFPLCHCDGRAQMGHTEEGGTGRSRAARRHSREASCPLERRAALVLFRLPTLAQCLAHDIHRFAFHNARLAGYACRRKLLVSDSIVHVQSYRFTLLPSGFLPSLSADLRHVILDEVDVLYEDPDFDEIWRMLRAKTPARASHTFVTATLPPPVEDSIRRNFPLAKAIKGPGLHQTRAGVRQKLIDCSAGADKVNCDDKAPALVERDTSRIVVLWKNGWTRKGSPIEDVGFQRKMEALLSELRAEPSPQTLVFCNTIESCRRVENALRRRDRRGREMDVAAFHAALTPPARKQALEKLIGAGQDTPDVPVVRNATATAGDHGTIDRARLACFAQPASLRGPISPLEEDF
eukprot:scaffold270313_cov31-Tisochrysis_lutea.AAC.2